MRAAWLALLLLAASCDRADRPGREAPVEAPPTITIAATGPGGCSAGWNGEAVTPAQLTERSRALLERVIMSVGGIQNITEDNLPVFNVEAPADLSFACADTILASLQRAGVPSVRLRLAGGGASLLADFPFPEDTSPPPPVPMAIGVEAGGRLTWNAAPIEVDALVARLRQLGSDTAAELDEMQVPPGGLELRPSREATYGQVHAVLRAIRARQIRPLLFLPSAEASPAAPAAPTPRR